MAADAKVLAGDGQIHLVPPMGRLTFCGQPPAAGDTDVSGRTVCAECRALAAERDQRQERGPR